MFTLIKIANEKIISKKITFEVKAFDLILATTLPNVFEYSWPYKTLMFKFLFYLCKSFRKSELNLLVWMVENNIKIKMNYYLYKGFQKTSYIFAYIKPVKELNLF